MQHILPLFCHIILVIAVQRLATRDLDFQRSPSIDLIVRSPGPLQTGRLSRGTTPERQRGSPQRSKSLPPARESLNRKNAEGLGVIEGKGRLSTVGEHRLKKAKLQTAVVERKATLQAAGDNVSVTGQTFSNDSKMMTEASGSLGITSKITTQGKSQGYIRAYAPGHATVRVSIEGNANAEVVLSNQDPHLGCTRVECFILGQGSSHLTAQHLAIRSMEKSEPE